MLKLGDGLSVILPKENPLAICNIDLLIEVKKFNLMSQSLCQTIKPFSDLCTTHTGYEDLLLVTAIVPSLCKLIFIFFPDFQIDLFKCLGPLNVSGNAAISVKAPLHQCQIPRTVCIVAYAV